MWPAALPQCTMAQAAQIVRVDPYTLGRVISVEGGGNPLAIRVNGLPAARQPHPVTTADAVIVADTWIARGYKVDMGLMQIDSGNLPALHQTVEQVMGTSGAAICANLAAGASILADNYGRAAARFGPGQMALGFALSAYNTGTWLGGWENGYVARYFVVPNLTPLAVPRVESVTMKRHSADTEVW